MPLPRAKRGICWSRAGWDLAVSRNSVLHFVRALIIRVLRFGVYIRALIVAKSHAARSVLQWWRRIPGLGPSQLHDVLPRLGQLQSALLGFHLVQCGAY